jgi:hypothetical protein
VSGFGKLSIIGSMLMDSGSSASGRCPYDGLPCSRFDDDLGCGVCEIRRVGLPADVCSRFVLKSDVPYYQVSSCKEG